MVKRFLYIVFLLVAVPLLLLADLRHSNGRRAFTEMQVIPNSSRPVIKMFADTVKTLKSNAKPDTKVKEVPKAKKQPKPEKVDEGADAKKDKPKRQRRPDGMERPPEIPRRIDN